MSGALHSDTDVLIVGAGPVGLTLALLLAKRGRSVALFERQSGVFPLPRAAAMSHETVRVLQSAGILDELRPLLDLKPEARSASYFAADGEVLMTMTFPGVGESGYPPMTNFHQPDLEQALCDACDSHPLIGLHRGWSARAIEQTEDHVTVTLDPFEGAPGAVGPVTARARFAVGCDGANSTVRSLMDTTVTDTGFSSTWVVIDVAPKPGMGVETAFGHLVDPARPATLAPAGKGRHRFEFMVVEGEDPETIIGEESAWALVKRWNVTPQTAEIARRAIYTFKGRWADTWRDGRVLLAGDAAHQMPPFMGQGMNSGMRDTVALAWRLDLVLGGKVSDALLDSYTPERLYHVKQIVETSVAIGQMICMTDPAAAEQRNAMMRMMRDTGMTPPEPEWRLGPGCFMPDDPAAGFLALQARLERDGRSGLADDVIGVGHFLLLGDGLDPDEHLSDEVRARWEDLGGLSVRIGHDGYSDPDGSYAAWFEKLNAKIVAVRPDFQVYGACAEPEQVGPMLKQLLSDCA